MARRQDVRRYGDDSCDTFEKMNGSAARIDNVSGAPSAYTELRPRDHSAITAPPRGRPLPHRTPMMINARTTRPALGRRTERAASDTAARHLTIPETIAQAGPSDKPMLEHLFGLNLPGRGRA